VSCSIFSELLTGNSNSRIRKSPPTKLAKVGALMVGGLFTIVIMVVKEKGLLK